MNYSNNLISYSKKCDIGSPIGEILIPENEPCEMWSNWELGTREFLMGKVDRGTHFLDIGANIGYFSLWASTVAEKVYSIEPNPILFEILKDNLLRFSGAKAYNIVLGDNTCIGGYTGHRAFYYRVDAAGDGRAYNPVECGDGNKWLMNYILEETLCSFQDKYLVKGEGINLIKIDCEGSEYDILKDIGFFKREENKNCLVILELHGPMIQSRGLDFNKFIEYLLNNFDMADIYGSAYNSVIDIPARGFVIMKLK